VRVDVSLVRTKLRNEVTGAPSFAPFAKGGFHESQRNVLHGLQSTQVESCGIPHLEKNERDTPNFLYAALDTTVCAPFFKERRIESDGTRFAPQEIGDMGAPVVFLLLDSGGRKGGGILPGLFSEPEREGKDMTGTKKQERSQ
jgi:hypothetical protein